MGTNKRAGGHNAQRTTVEQFKEASSGLYGPVSEEMGEARPNFTEESVQVLKHHGIYQQDNRGTRTERKKAGLDRDYKFMVRTKLPGGRLSARQYLFCDESATRYGEDNLRVTSRQDLQFQGILKKNLRSLIQELSAFAEIATLGACGDVVRNVVAVPVADIDTRFRDCGTDLLDIARRISDHFVPRTTSYYDLWLDNERVTVRANGTVVFPGGNPKKGVDEPLYGEAYLPRKLKIAIATDFDNSVDVFTNDVGIIAVTEAGKIVGHEILVGGGLGYTHRKVATYPRLGTPLALVAEQDLLSLLDAIVKIQRDHGDRTNRRHARMKYLIDDWGFEKFRNTVYEYAGRTYPEPRRVTPSAQPDYLGWHRQIQPGLNYVGLWIENGRIRDFPEYIRFKTGLREVVAAFEPDLRLTPHHNVILANIKDRDVNGVQALLEKYGLPTDKGISRLRRLEMACPALPYCGFALSEAERALPGVVKAIETAGHRDAEVIIRMSGCPNNCSRPRSAEIGIVGSGTDRYHLYTGGNHVGSRLNELLLQNVRTSDLGPTIAALLDAWKERRQADERFGDWAYRVGTEELVSISRA